MCPEPTRELTDSFDRRIAAFADDIGRTKRACQRDAVGVTPKHDDPFGTEPAGRNDAARADRAVSDHGHRFARTDTGG